MPRLFILLASAIAASFILPEIKILCVDQSPVKKEYNHPRKLNDTTFLLKGKITGQKKGYIKLIYTDKNACCAALIIFTSYQYSFMSRDHTSSAIINLQTVSMTICDKMTKRGPPSNLIAEL